MINKNKQLFINMFTSVLALAVNMGINFFLSPYIVKNVGEEAYGFVSLTNNLLSYFSIITIALNSMSSRFISVHYFKGEIDQAQQYYSSTFFSNLFLCVIFSPIICLGIYFIEKIINISNFLLDDVKLLMCFMAMNFFIDLLCINMGISYYIKNQLYRSSIINAIGYILKAILLLILFTFFDAHIFYLGLVALIVVIYTQVCNIYYKKKLLPDLRIKLKDFHVEKIKKLIFSGIWNSITRIGTLLQEGIDLLITNLMISPQDMGVLAIAKMVPNIINMLLNTIIGTFMPNLTELYATNQKDMLLHDIKQSMKIIGMIINIPIALLIGFGDVLFELWFPTQDAQLLQILSILTIAPWAVMGQATIIHNIFTVVNKIKVNSLLVCLTGFLNVGIVYFLLKYTGLGLFAVAGVSSVLSILRNVLYTVPAGAIYIKFRWYTFFPEIGKSICSVSIVSIVSYVIKTNMLSVSWVNLIICSVLASLFGLVFNFYLVLNANDRKFLISKVRRRRGGTN